MKHTKGPWKVRVLSPRKQIVENHCYSLDIPIYEVNDSKKLMAERVFIADCGGHSMAKSNANLIAASPDLLEACEESLVFLKTLLSIKKDGMLNQQTMEAFLDTILEQIIKDSDKAIAKAKGK